MLIVLVVLAGYIRWLRDEIADYRRLTVAFKAGCDVHSPADLLFCPECNIANLKYEGVPATLGEMLDGRRRGTGLRRCNGCDKYIV